MMDNRILKHEIQSIECGDLVIIGKETHIVGRNKGVYGVTNLLTGEVSDDYHCINLATLKRVLDEKDVIWCPRDQFSLSLVRK
jgi:hypothetical protein